MDNSSDEMGVTSSSAQTVLSVRETEFLIDGGVVVRSWSLEHPVVLKCVVAEREGEEYVSM